MGDYSADKLLENITYLQNELIDFSTLIQKSEFKKKYLNLYFVRHLFFLFIGLDNECMNQVLGTSSKNFPFSLVALLNISFYHQLNS